MEDRYHNPDAVVRLVGPANESVVVLEGKRLKALIDSGAQLSSIPISLVRKLRLRLFHLDTIIEAERTGGGLVQYHGYVEVRLQIPGIKTMDMDTLFMVVDDSPYTDRVPVQLGTLQIDEAIKRATEKELKSLSQSWQRANFPNRLSAKGGTINKPTFDLTKAKGTVKLLKKVTINPFDTVYVTGKTKFKDHYKRLNIIVSAVKDRNYTTVIPVNTYTCMKPGSIRVTFALRNLSSRKVEVPAKSVTAKFIAANAVPKMLAPKDEPKQDSVKEQQVLTPEQEKRFFEKLDLSGNQEWPSELREKTKNLFRRYGYLFALENLDLGHTSLVKHKIRLTDNTPFKERYRRIPPHLYDEVKKHLQEMLEIGAIRRSNSPWASAVVLVRKRDGSLRFCIDLRKLNARTVKDAYSLPRIDETLDCLSGSRIFTSLDLKSGYWQVEMDDASKELTAFTVGPLGFYECERMPFGLTNVPATFQRLMEGCLGDLHLNWCIIYLDDIIIYSVDPDEHLKRLEGVFAKLASAGLKLKPSKCEFFKTRIKYLGHIVSEEGIETDPEKIDSVRKWPTPRTVTDVRSFLGFTNHYRRFIPKYARVARQLNSLISGDNAKRKNKEVRWTPDCEEAFQKLKELCTQTPILGYANYEKPFRLHTDASCLGLGAVLYQTDKNGVERVIAYASRSLSHTEQNYPAHKLEFLALKWSVTERFHEYLYGGKFDVYTDNNPLTYVLTTAKLDATGQRWIAALANYDFTLHYKSGKTNVEADALSRIPQDMASDRHLDKETIHAIAQGVQITDFALYGGTYLPLVTKTQQVVTAKMTNADWQKEQMNDEDIGMVLRCISGEQCDRSKISEDCKTILRRRSRLITRNGLLYRKFICTNTKEQVFQFVLPRKFRLEALQACHDNIGHLGIERTHTLLRDRFYWPGMKQDVDDYVGNCPRCLRFKTIPDRAELNPITVTRPFELVHMDFLTIEPPVKSKLSKDVNLLVITDHFTRYAQAIVTSSQKATTVAKALWDHWFVHYGFPEKILSDQGRNFESDLIAELCRMTQITKLRTTPYRPEGNGACERFNRTLISMLGTLPEDHKSQWTQYVSTLVHAYNCTRSNATGYSPYFLIFGKKPLLPIDIEYGVATPDISDVITHKYVKKLQHRLEWAYRKASDYSKKEAQRAKARYDQKVRCSKLEPGDLVLMRRKGFTVKHKIADRWENIPYKVIRDKIDGIPVFEVESTHDQKRRVVHRNMLFPIKFNIYSDIDSNLDAVVDGGSAKESVDLENVDSTSEGVPTYTGPQTRSRTKALMKANVLMEKHFMVDEPLNVNVYSPDELSTDLVTSLRSFVYLQYKCFTEAMVTVLGHNQF